jgi:hypothetical protein
MGTIVSPASGVSVGSQYNQSNNQVTTSYTTSVKKNGWFNSTAQSGAIMTAMLGDGVVRQVAYLPQFRNQCNTFRCIHGRETSTGGCLAAICGLIGACFMVGAAMAAIALAPELLPADIIALGAAIAAYESAQYAAEVACGATGG